MTATRYITRDNTRLAYAYTAGNSSTAVMFCGGFNSNMQGTKAVELQACCAENDTPYIRFDYSGHGASDGEFSDGDIGRWLADAIYVFDQIARPKHSHILLIGSSMGAWIATLLAEQRSDSVAGLLTLAAAPDFTERLLLAKLNDSQRQKLSNGETLLLPSKYDDGAPYPISPRLINESRPFCLLDRTVELNVPVRMIHGTSDIDVPYQLSIEVMQSISSTDIRLNLLKGADHRLSNTEQLQVIKTTLLALLASDSDK